MAFSQLVIGPPGSGKTTYCQGMRDFLVSAGRTCVIVNLDPANDNIPYECAVSIHDLITLEDVMDNLGLGPNGGLVHCIEYLEKNLDWLKDALKPHEGSYILFDCPGQVELYTHNNSIHRIVDKLQTWNYRLAAVHLVDSHYCTDPGKFVSVLMTSLSTMLQIALPHINVLSKVDLIERYDKLAFNMDFYTDVLDLNHLLHTFSEDPFLQRYKKLNSILCELVEDYGLVNFYPLNVQDQDSMLVLAKAIDKANGYIFGGLDGIDSNPFEITQAAIPNQLDALDMRERFIDRFYEQPPEDSDSE